MKRTVVAEFEKGENVRVPKDKIPILIKNDHQNCVGMAHDFDYKNGQLSCRLNLINNDVKPSVCSVGYRVLNNEDKDIEITEVSIG